MSPSSRSRRSPASTFSRIGSSVEVRSRTATTRSCSTTASVIASNSSRAATPFRYPRARSAYRRATWCASSTAPLAATRSMAPSSEPPASAARTTSSLRAASSSGSVGDPLPEVGAGDLPGLDRLARAVEAVVDDLEGDAEREAERAELSRRPPPSRHAASKSFAVFSAQRSRYSSTVVSGRRRCMRCSPRPERARAPHRRGSPTARMSPVAASSAKARAKR